MEAATDAGRRRTAPGRYHGDLFCNRSTAMDRYVVIGNPVAHSLSPAIHALFSTQTGDAIAYERLAAPLDAFASTAQAFFDAGGRGANVTLPFKEEALRFANVAAGRAQAAGAANFLAAQGGRIEADNTDGAGLVIDLAKNLGTPLEHAKVLVIGAGGAARGIVAPLLASGVASLTIANRNAARGEALARRFAAQGPIAACALDAIAGGPFDIVLNATSSSIHGEPLAVDREVFASASLVYDLAYGEAARPFLAMARAAGARTSDGLGMLVEQAAESFLLWRCTRPQTAPVIAELRARAS